VDDRPRQRHHLRNQMANMLHALGSTFTTCACGARARDCALTQMAAFVDGEIESGGRVNLGPLIGVERGFKTREKVPWSGGMGGVEMVTAKQEKGEENLEDMEVVGGGVHANADIDANIDIEWASASESSSRDESGVLRREFISFPSSTFNPS
jgi:hypothetical protein